ATAKIAGDAVGTSKTFQLGQKWVSDVGAIGVDELALIVLGGTAPEVELIGHGGAPRRTAGRIRAWSVSDRSEASVAHAPTSDRPGGGFPPFHNPRAPPPRGF